jgi:hypothetical protein
LEEENEQLKKELEHKEIIINERLQYAFYSPMKSDYSFESRAQLQTMVEKVMINSIANRAVPVTLFTQVIQRAFSLNPEMNVPKLLAMFMLFEQPPTNMKRREELHNIKYYRQSDWVAVKKESSKKNYLYRAQSECERELSIPYLEEEDGTICNAHTASSI